MLLPEDSPAYQQALKDYERKRHYSIGDISSFLLWLTENNAKLTCENGILAIDFGHIEEVFELPTRLNRQVFWDQFLKYVALEIYTNINPPPTPPDKYEGPIDDEFIAKLRDLTPEFLSKLVSVEKLTKAILQRRPASSFASLGMRYANKKFELLGSSK